MSKQVPFTAGDHVELIQPEDLEGMILTSRNNHKDRSTLVNQYGNQVLKVIACVQGKGDEWMVKLRKEREGEHLLPAAFLTRTQRSFGGNPPPDSLLVLATSSSDSDL